MKSNTYELHNYVDSDMELEKGQAKTVSEDSRKRKASAATGSRRGEKYSLRQKRQKRVPGDLPAPMTAPATEELQPAATVCSKAKAKTTAKTKAPPLSKYRRKTANARERTRMREINMAFEHLRHCVPQSITGEDAATTNEKLTKITTLRLAMKYIGMLSESLQDPSYESEFLVECLRESANREAHVSVDTEPDLDLDVELEPTPPAKPKKPVKANKKSPAKRQCKQSKATVVPATPVMTNTTNVPISSPESCYASSSVGSPAFCPAASSPSSAYASLSSAASSGSSSSGSVHGSAVLDTDSLLGMQALDELNTLLLESDSDSLHCLNSYHPELLVSASSALPSRGDLPISINLTLDKPDVELSLRMLDHSTDSFDFASDQQPSACISPLATLDSFHPFADLLHGEFSDIFLR